MKVNTDSDIDVYYDAKHYKLINKPSKKDSGFVDILQFNLISKGNEKYLVRFCEGLSGDPWFGFNRINGDSLIFIGGIAGTILYLPGAGNIYVSSSVNTSFDMKLKYSATRDTVKEVEQPFYYVGNESITLEDITIYSDIDKTNIVASLPKGTPIFIVGNKGFRNYLLKTPFGLLGWFEIKYEYGETELKGIFNGE
jgi:hypothetical protein